MVQNAYNITQLHALGETGTGQTIAIVDACNDPSIVSDLASFDAQFGLPNPTLNVIYPQGTPSCPFAQKGWDVEISLDVEWAHVMAPTATIDLLLAKSASTANLVGAWNYALTNHKGSVISNSWGSSSTCSTSMQSALSKAKTNHVTILASAGDSGAWGTGTSQSIESPADCNGVLTVGGTTLNVDSNGNYLSEQAWGSSCIAGTGTGGGFVTGTAEPSYQANAAIFDPYALLGKPDVAAVADPCTGVWVYDSQTYSGWTSTWGVVGGTSLSCPLWAGFLADVNQMRAAQLPTPLNPVGVALIPFLYSSIYGHAGSGTAYGTDFHDVISGTNGLPAGQGWDPDTGLGTPIASNLAQVLGTNPSA